MNDPLLFLMPIALLGHAFLGIAWINWSHGLGWSRRVSHGSAWCVLAWVGLLPTLVAACYVPPLAPFLEWAVDIGHSWVGRGYFALSCAGGVWALGLWTWRRFLRGSPRASRSCRRECLLNDPPPLGPNARGLLARFLLRFPGNEISRLHLTRRELAPPRLPRSLDGLTIVHLSDVHLTGLIDRRYFEEVVRRADELEPDLVLVTGDLVDDPACMDWLPDTLGRLRGRHGTYFILGNHDRYVDSHAIRRILGECGGVDLGGRHTTLEIRGAKILLRGNELPWFRRASDLPGVPEPSGECDFRILLAHGPDLFAWAQAQDIDLMLCGHTHGGQICLPGIGPLFTPSLHGVGYADGVFLRGNTLMCVHRGVSGEVPLRLFCPPEIVHLTLRSPS